MKDLEQWIHRLIKINKTDKLVRVIDVGYCGWRGCAIVYTTDKKLHKLAEITLLSDDEAMKLKYKGAV